MIQRLEITGVHLEVGADLKKYVLRKIGKLSNYMPRQARQSAHAEVKLKESKAKNKLSHTCEVIMHLPGDLFILKESAKTIFEAVDVAEAKLKIHLKKYKDLRTTPRLHQRPISFS
ncbi:MAG TPA: ribosome-associated translation inhibitor RaiA [Candidatus Saccharimonadales bacterium]|nr:ribosome-associated translation inhibitor RaiA [Candidatus Saccharimonadales bacterium]